MKAYEEIHLVITTLEKIRNKVDEFHHECFVYAKDLAIKIEVDVKKATHLPKIKVQTKCRV